MHGKIKPKMPSLGSTAVVDPKKGRSEKTFWRVSSLVHQHVTQCSIPLQVMQNASKCFWRLGATLETGVPKDDIDYTATARLTSTSLSTSGVSSAHASCCSTTQTRKHTIPTDERHWCLRLSPASESAFTSSDIALILHMGSSRQTVETK